MTLGLHPRGALDAGDLVVGRLGAAGLADLDDDVDAVLIGNTIALAGNLNVLKDSLYHEKIDQSTKNNINVLATAKKNKNNAAYKKLGKLYHNKQIQKWIAKKYSGTKVEVNKPVSYLTD